MAKINCPHCSGEIDISVVRREDRRWKSGRKTVLPAKCPECGKGNGGNMSHFHHSGYWRRHKCCNCGTQYGSVCRQDGHIEVYDRMLGAGSQDWAPVGTMHSSDKLTDEQMEWLGERNSAFAKGYREG